MIFACKYKANQGRLLILNYECDSRLLCLLNKIEGIPQRSDLNSLFRSVLNKFRHFDCCLEGSFVLNRNSTVVCTQLFGHFLFALRDVDEDDRELNLLVGSSLLQLLHTCPPIGNWWCS